MIGRAQLRPQRKVAHQGVERQIAIVIIIGVKMPALLQAVQPMPHRVQIHHHLLGMFGQATRPHLQQARLDFGRIVRNLVAAVAPVVGQLQTVERAGGRQRDAPVGRVDAIPSQRIRLVARGGQQGVQPQSLVIVEVFVTLRQSVDALGQHLLHGVVHPNWIAPVLKALRQGPGQPKTGIDLAEQQGAAIGGKEAAGKIGHDLAQSQVGKKKGFALRGRASPSCWQI